MKKIVMCLLVSMVMVAFAAPVFAQDVKIGMVNVQRVLAESTASKAAQQKLTTTKDKYEADLNKKGQAIEDMGKKLEKEASVMSQDAIDKIVADAQGKVDEFRKLENQYGQDLSNMEVRYLETLQKEVGDVVAEIAKKNNYVVVLNNMSVLYYQQVIDITDEVIKTLNARNIKIN